MTWFKNIFGLQYGFSSESSSQDSSQGSSQEPKVHYTKEKNETDANEKDIENLTIKKFEECDETTLSTQNSCYCWSGVSQKIAIKGETWELSEDKEEPCGNLSKHNQVKNRHKALRRKNCAVHKLARKLVHKQKLVHHR